MQVVHGTLRLHRLSDASWTGSIEVDAAPSVEAVKVDYDDDGQLVFVAEGPSRLIRVVATISGAEIEGTWSIGGRSGVFRATKALF